MSMEKTHPNSRLIRIKRAQPFKHEQMDSAVMQEQLSFTKRGLGGYFASKSSKRSGSGLVATINEKINKDYSEEQILMKMFLNVDPKVSGADYFNKVEEFFAEINTVIPHGPAGLLLEIGLERDNKAPVNTDNMPLSIEDYIRYRHAKSHPYCASSPEAAAGNQLYSYYIEEDALVLSGRVKEVEIADTAMLDYQQNKGKIDTVRMVVGLMRFSLRPIPGKPKINPKTAREEDLLLAFRELSINKPAEFSATVNDQDVRKRWFIDCLIDAQILRRIGNTIQVTENGFQLGETTAEVLVNLWNSQNTALLQELKAKLKEIEPELIK